MKRLTLPLLDQFHEMICLTVDDVLGLGDTVAKMATCADHVFLLSSPRGRIRLKEQTWYITKNSTMNMASYKI